MLPLEFGTIISLALLSWSWHTFGKFMKRNLAENQSAKSQRYITMQYTSSPALLTIVGPLKLLVLGIFHLVEFQAIYSKLLPMMTIQQKRFTCKANRDELLSKLLQNDQNFSFVVD